MSDRIRGSADSGLEDVRILLLSRYDRSGASSRLRVMQFLPFLAKAGAKVDVDILFPGASARDACDNSGRARWAAYAGFYLGRLRTLLSANRYDLVWVQKEIFPFLPAMAESLLHVPTVIDLDDALFHQYGQHPNPVVRWLLGGKFDEVFRKSRAVVAGSEYIAEVAKAAGARAVTVVPTGLDCQRYRDAKESRVGRPFTIGWIGSPYSQRYLDPLLPTLRSYVREHSARLLLVGAELQNPMPEIESLKWTEADEARQIGEMDVGIMPLDDDDFSRGKCSYKLVQYMAAGVPVIASPVGGNVRIVTESRAGFLASTLDEWVASLDRLRTDMELREISGSAGREYARSNHDISVLASQLLGVMKAALS